MPLVTFLLWFSLVFSIGWLFFPFSLRSFGAVLPDGGLAIGRVLFLAFWTLGAFWAGQWGVSTQISTLLGLFLAFFGIVVAWRQKSRLKTEVKVRRRAIWMSETIFVLIFLAFFALRGFWSDTNGTNGEKSMDNALMSSLVRAQHLPPPNPYAANATLTSYYYFGHLQSALLTNAVNSHPRWTYNLMCATLPALCLSALFSLGAGLTRSLRGGLFVSATTLGLGTLQPIYQWLNPSEFTASAPFRLDFFAVSRVIPYSINEFPFFTFNQADLHAHYFGLPLALAIISLSYAIFRGQKAAITPAIAILAAQILTNTWDFPAYALLFGLSVGGVAKSQSQGVIQKEKLGVPPKSSANFGRVIFFLMGAMLLASPYLLGLKTAASPPKLLHFPASPLREWLLLWGIFAAAWLAFLAYSVEDTRRFRTFCLSLGAMFLLYAFAIPWKRPDPFALPLMVGLLALSIWRLKKLQNEARFLCFLAIAGLCALIWSETTWAGFLGDAKNLGFDDYKRQDTVFKFGLQTWILWGVAASCGAVVTLKKWPLLLKFAFLPALSIMAMASVAAMFGRTRNFEKWDGWDGWAHLAPSEKLAAQWLVDHVPTGQNLLEAEQQEGGDYSPYSRYASATGIPTIIGPQAHTFQWSPANSGVAQREWDEVFRRKEMARAIYTVQGASNRGSTVRRDWLRSFGVRYIVVGELERAQYGPDVLENLRIDPNLVEIARFDAPEEKVERESEREFGAPPDVPHNVQIFQVR